MAKSKAPNVSEIQEKAGEILSVLKSIQSDVVRQSSSFNKIMNDLSLLERTIKSDRDLRQLRFDKRLHMDSFSKSIKSVKSQLLKTSKDIQKVCVFHEDSSWIPEESVFE